MARVTTPSLYNYWNYPWGLNINPLQGFINYELSKHGRNAYRYIDNWLWPRKRKQRFRSPYTYLKRPRYRRRRYRRRRPYRRYYRRGGYNSGYSGGYRTNTDRPWKKLTPSNKHRPFPKEWYWHPNRPYRLPGGIHDFATQQGWHTDTAYAEPNPPDRLYFGGAVPNLAQWINQLFTGSSGVKEVPLRLGL